MRKDRLLKLAGFLDTVPSRKFDLVYWQKDRSCGTTACACGWASKLFNKCRGDDKLVLIDTNDDEYILESKDGSCEGFDAAARFFGISERSAINLFHPSYYPEGHTNAKYVANRIRQFIKTGTIKSKYARL